MPFIDRILDVMEERWMPPGSVVAREGMANDTLYVLIRARNCQTILNAAHHFRLDPDPYKLVSAEPAKRLLRQLEQWDAATFSDALRAACRVK